MQLDTIPGLSVSLATRLQAGGIETAEQLAAADIDVLRELPGRPISLGAAQRWITAASLVVRPAPSSPPATRPRSTSATKPRRGPAAPSELRTSPDDSSCDGSAGLERHESFTVSLSIDPTGDVCRTVVHHVRSGLDQGFPGFFASDVADFIGRHAKVAALSPSTALAAAAAIPVNSATGIATDCALASTAPTDLPVTNRAVIDAGRMVIRLGQTTAVVIAPQVIPVNCHLAACDALIELRRLGGGSRLPITRRRVVADRGEPIELLVGGDVDSGVYDVTVALEWARLAHHHRVA